MLTDASSILLCRFANAIVFMNEMNGLTLTDAAGQPVRGEELAATSNLNNNLGIGVNLAVLLGILVGLRVIALIALKISHRLNWL
jgi:hypothetical protein